MSTAQTADSSWSLSSTFLSAAKTALPYIVIAGVAYFGLSAFVPGMPDLLPNIIDTQTIADGIKYGMDGVAVLTELPGVLTEGYNAIANGIATHGGALTDQLGTAFGPAADALSQEWANSQALVQQLLESGCSYEQINDLVVNGTMAAQDLLAQAPKLCGPVL